jgi:hypothetical protein
LSTPALGLTCVPVDFPFGELPANRWNTFWKFLRLLERFPFE